MWIHHISTIWMWMYCGAMWMYFGAMWISIFQMWINEDTLWITIVEINVHSLINANLMWTATHKMWIHHILTMWILHIFKMWRFHTYTFDNLTYTLSSNNPIFSQTLKLLVMWCTLYCSFKRDGPIIFGFIWGKFGWGLLVFYPILPLSLIFSGSSADMTEIFWLGLSLYWIKRIITSKVNFW